MRNFPACLLPALFLMLPLLTGSGCMATRKKESSPQVIAVAENARFKVIEAWQESWKPGIAGAQGDTEYTIALQLLPGAVVTFQYLYLNGRRLPVSIQNAPGRISTMPPAQTPFETPQTVWLHSSASSGKPHNLFQKRAASHPNEAILSYTWAGEIFYLLLPPFTLQKTPNRP